MTMPSTVQPWLLIVVATLLLFCSNLVLVTAQDDKTFQFVDCSTTELQVYTQCIESHQDGDCSCTHCDANPVDGTPYVAVQVPRNCADVHDVYCPLLRCCTPCAAVAEAWYTTCSANAFAQHYLGNTCRLDCRRYAWGDGCDRTELPTTSPTVSPTFLPTTSSTVSPTFVTLEPSAANVTTSSIIESNETTTTSNETDRGDIVFAVSPESFGMRLTMGLLVLLGSALFGL